MMTWPENERGVLILCLYSLPEDQSVDLATLASHKARQWWHTALIPALGRQRQMDLCEFKATLGYTR